MTGAGDATDCASATELTPPARQALSRALLARLSDQCAALEAAIASGHQQARSLREMHLVGEGLDAFTDAVAQMAGHRDALEASLGRLVEAAQALSSGPIATLREAGAFLDPLYLRAWEGGLARLSSLNASLAEQQAAAEIHARRGLTVLDAWRNVLGAPTDAGPTYNRYGQTRGQSPEAPPRLTIKL
jgi:hypothetical protein